MAYVIWSDLGLSRRKRDHVLTDHKGHMLRRSYEIGRLFHDIYERGGDRALICGQGRTVAVRIVAFDSEREP